MDACSGFMRASVCHRVPPSYSIQQYRNRATVHGMYIKLYRYRSSLRAGRWSNQIPSVRGFRLRSVHAYLESNGFVIVYATRGRAPAAPPAASRIAMGGGLDLRAQLN